VHSTRKGTLVIIGGEGGGRWLQGTDRVLRATLLSPFVSQRLRGMIAGERLEDLEQLRELIDAGRVTPVIDRTYPLSDAADAIDHVHDGHTAGKVVLTV
jgi:NADPH:quinone reductase-like Zn-dependent oxidoreductase